MQPSLRACPPPTPRAPRNRKRKDKEQRLPPGERGRDGDHRTMTLQFRSVHQSAHTGPGPLTRPGWRGRRGTGGAGVGPYLPSDPAGSLLEIGARTTVVSVELGVCKDYLWGIGWGGGWDTATWPWLGPRQGEVCAAVSGCSGSLYGAGRTTSGRWVQGRCRPGAMCWVPGKEGPCLCPSLSPRGDWEGQQVDREVP